jgi:O-antigen/teichoic acid export membrane protein
MVSSFATLLTGEGVARVFGLVSVLVLARELGPGGFGVVAVGATIMTWLGFVADAGTEMLSTRDVARRPAQFRRIAEALLGLRLVLSILCGAVLALGAYLFARSDTSREVYALFALVLPAAALNLRWVILGVSGARLIAIGNVIGQAVLMCGALLLVRGHGDVTVVPLLYVAAELAYAAVILALLLPRFGLLRPRVDRPLWRSTLRGGAPLMVSTLARGALGAVDVAALGFLLGPAAAGTYSAGSRPVLFALTAVGIFFYSFVVSYSSASAPERVGLLRSSTRASLGVALLAALGLTVLAVPLVSLLFGDAYSDAALVLAILAWKVPASAAGSPFVGVLLAHGRQVTLMWNFVLGAVAAVLLVVPAALLLEGPGVAAASVLATLLVTALSIRSARPLVRDVRRAAA